MTQVTLGPAFGGGFDIGDFEVATLHSGARTLVSSSLVRITTSDGMVHEITGSGFQQSGNQITGGTVTGYSASLQGATWISMAGLSISAPTFFGWIDAGDTDAFLDGTLGGADVIFGSTGDDVFLGRGGDDRFTGGGGSDIFSGGDGVDTAVFNGNRADYSVSFAGSRTDVRSPTGAGDAVGLGDLLFGVEFLQFANATLDLSKVDAGVSAAWTRILRTASSPSADLALDVGNGLRTREAAVGVIVDGADASSSVATLAYQFFTGRTPTTAGMDYLVSPTGPNPNNINSAYYQNFNLENRYINFAVNLGKLGEGQPGFSAEYGALTLFEATRAAYAEIFGGTPSDAKVSALLTSPVQVSGMTMTRAEYFAIYGQDGANGIGTKAAMVGWLLAEAAKADLGVYARSNEAYLMDVGLNNAPYGVDLVGVYNRPEYVYQPD